MGLILDTSILVDVKNNVSSTIKYLDTHREINTFMSFITYFEFLYGIREKSKSNKEKILSDMEWIGILSANAITGLILAEFKNSYKSKGISFSLADLIIGAQAYQNKLKLITKDKNFSKLEEIDSVIL